MSEFDPREDDPTTIFAALRDVEIPESLLASLSERVSAELDREVGRRTWFRPAVAWAAAASLAFGLLVSGALRRQPTAPVVPMAAVVPAGAEAPRAGIEALRTPGSAQVLDLTVGDTQVVMIFDDELSL